MLDKQVQGGQNQPGVAKPTTPGAGGSVANATPATTPADAELKRLQEQYKAVLESNKKLEGDLNKLKSASQRREDQLQKEANQRELEWRAQIQKANMSTMDDEARAAYENELAREQLQQAMQELEELRVERTNLEAKQRAFEWFKESGVPIDRLDLSGSIEDLTQSGYGYLAESARKLRELESQSQSPQPETAPVDSAAPAPLPNAPSPDLGAGGTPAIGPTWEEVDDKWKGKGGREAFYVALQNGELPPDALPMNKEE